MKSKDNEFIKISESYLQSSVILMQHIQHIGDLPYWYLPILYLLRHSIELALKANIIDEYSKKIPIFIESDDDAKKFFIDVCKIKHQELHSISSLFKCLQKYNKDEYETGKYSFIYSEMSKFIDDMDPNGTSFKYNPDGENPEHIFTEILSLDNHIDLNTLPEDFIINQYMDEDNFYNKTYHVTNVPTFVFMKKATDFVRLLHQGNSKSFITLHI